MKCKICKKTIKENTDGDDKYCQGHFLFSNLSIEDNITYHKKMDNNLI
jgi:hypothetical protein